MPGYADRHVDDPPAPRPPERVRHDDRDVDAESVADRGPDRGRPTRRGRPGRSVTIEPLAGPTLRRVDAAVGADEAMGGLGDDHPVGHPDDAPRLAQHDLDLARIAIPALGERDRLRAWLDRGQVDDRALGLGHDLLGDDEDVVRAGAAREPSAISVASRRRRGAPGGRRRAGSPGSRRARRPRAGRRRQPPRAGSSRPSSSARMRSSGRSRSMASGPSSSTTAAPAAWARGQVRGAAAAAERERDRVGRAHEQRVRAPPVAVGDDRHERPVGSRAGGRRATRASIVVGRDRPAGRPPGPGSRSRHRGRGPARPPSTAPFSPGRAGGGRRAPAALASPEDRRVRAHHDHRGDRPTAAAAAIVRSSRSRTRSGAPPRRAPRPAATSPPRGRGRARRP